MRIDVTWNKRDPELGRVQLRVLVWRGKVEWSLKTARFEEWQAYAQPSEADWAELDETIERHRTRKYYAPELLDLVRRRGR